MFLVDDGILQLLERALEVAVVECNAFNRRIRLQQVRDELGFEVAAIFELQARELGKLIDPPELWIVFELAVDNELLQIREFRRMNGMNLVSDSPVLLNLTYRSDGSMGVLQCCGDLPLRRS